MGGPKVRRRELAPLRKGVRSGNQATAKVERHIRERDPDETKSHRFATPLAPLFDIMCIIYIWNWP